MAYLGNSNGLGSSAATTAAAVLPIPATALLDETSAAILDEDGGYILDES